MRLFGDSFLSLNKTSSIESRLGYILVWRLREVGGNFGLWWNGRHAGQSIQRVRNITEYFRMKLYLVITFLRYSNHE